VVKKVKAARGVLATKGPFEYTEEEIELLYRQRHMKPENAKTLERIMNDKMQWVRDTQIINKQ